jgi:aldose sugar dehydrogenase
MLRMNTDGTIPADNPITDSYVYSFGHRNVQGIVRAPNGIIYLSEHGASTDDEFQILEVNRNYGWPNVEGFCDLAGEQTFCTANNVMEPLAVWTPTIAPSDMIWYENPEFPEFDGKILMSVLKDKKIVAIELNTDGTQYVSETHYLTNQFGRLRDICEGADKELYLATNGASWSNTNPTHTASSV